MIAGRLAAVRQAHGPTPQGPGKMALSLSAGFHLLLVLAAWLGLPALVSPPVRASAPALEIELAAGPPAVRAPMPDPAPLPRPEPEPAPIPAPEPEVKPLPAPEAKPDPEEKPPVPVQPAPATPAPRLQPTAQPEARKNPQPAPVKPVETASPDRKPDPAKPQNPKPADPKNDSFAALLKTVEKLKPAASPASPPPKAVEKPEKPVEPPRELRNILGSLRPGGTADQTPAALPGQQTQLSADELDAVKRQVAGCWNIQPGAMNAEGLIVRLRVAVNPDRSVRTVDILGSSAERANPFWDAAARSARTAVLKCSPLNLPAGKYADWQIVNFTFDPKEMFGL